MRIWLAIIVLFLSACGSSSASDDATTQKDTNAVLQDTSIDALFSDAPGSDLGPVDDQNTPEETVQPDTSVTADQTTPPPTGCAPLAAPSGKIVEVTPADADKLRQIVANAETGTTILLADGIYKMNKGDSTSRIQFNTPGITLRSKSGNPTNVILDGDYKTNELISIYASNITIAEVTLREAFDHPIHISGRPGEPISGSRIYRVHVIDPGQQAIKINPVDDGYVDNGIIECSLMELTDAGRPHIRDNCYTGGVDAHKARGWIVRDNLIKGFWCANGLSEHGVHFWQACRDTLVERNTIINCARGIGFGLNQSGGDRSYNDDPYPGVGYKGHIDGIIRNNFIFASTPRFDSGISLEQAYGALVLHNTVVSSVTPLSSSIEYRFGNTIATITNNLVSHNIKDRGGKATLAGNLEQAPLSYFVDPQQGDLHLTSNAPLAIDKGVTLDNKLCGDDIDGDLRSGPRDVGADER